MFKFKEIYFEIGPEYKYSFIYTFIWSENFQIPEQYKYIACLTYLIWALPVFI